jgi:hypothetical protein
MENWGLLLFDEARFLVNEVGTPFFVLCSRGGRFWSAWLISGASGMSAQWL